MTGYRGLGFDPTPGSPDAVAAVAAEYGAAAEALAQVDPVLRRDTTSWAGPTASAFRDRLAQLPPDLDERATALRRAADTLATWAQTLVAAKRTADELDREAVALRRRIADAQDEVHARRTDLDLASTAAAAATAAADHARAESGLADLSDRLAAVVRRARTLAADHERAAADVADALDELRAPGAAPATTPPDTTRGVVALLDRMSTTSAALASLFAPRRDTFARPPSALSTVASGVAVPVPPPDRGLIIVGETALGRR
ncbi:hypothetical protein [Actinokineospora sp. NBRC 105648]|uniref:hypothetical protein n=1 Tax=Actinokineospora sp. NBRC 105648 TaxID=3032206 RepID=UPI0024A02792|nr:hypothetical protein [Actinokineospora sp. NBRC 105648]GLZ38328.1 hypothetical protein Acsp05_19520 [Actinokineospora sp. NBRC 105648]